MQNKIIAKKDNAIRILGIDPGLQITGFGVIESDGRSSRYIHSGNIRANSLKSDVGIAAKIRFDLP